MDMLGADSLPVGQARRPLTCYMLESGWKLNKAM